jgi:hypothetical protein
MNAYEDDEDEFTANMISELRSCANSHIYFANRYMPEGDAMQQVMLHDTLFNSMRTNVVMFNTLDAARESMAAVMDAMEQMPEFLIPEVGPQTTTQVRFENGSELIFTNGLAKNLKGMGVHNLAISTKLSKPEFAELRKVTQPMLAAGTRVHYF